MLEGKGKIAAFAIKGSFAEAEDMDVEYYAGITWKESVANVEEMRRRIWSEEYKSERVRSISKAGLKDDRDDFK